MKQATATTAYMVSFFLYMTATQHKLFATTLLLSTLLAHVIVAFADRPRKPKPKDDEPLELITNRGRHEIY